eukprot:5587661-Amphidinium_carterae.2
MSAGAPGDGIHETLMRVKMSEYLCLAAYREAVEILTQKKDAESCFTCAASLADLLRDALDQAP